jgi:hypothetical protein
VWCARVLLMAAMYVFMYECGHRHDLHCSSCRFYGFGDLVDCNVLLFGSVEAMMEITSLVPQVRN